MVSRLQQKNFPDNYLMIPTHPTLPYLIPSSFSLPSYKKKENLFCMTFQILESVYSPCCNGHLPPMAKTLLNYFFTLKSFPVAKIRLGTPQRDSLALCHYPNQSTSCSGEKGFYSCFHSSLGCELLEGCHCALFIL